MSYYDDASLVLIPSGVKASKVYSQKPTNGTGDLTFSRASTATRTNASGVIESVASNVPRLDYSGGATCPRLLLEPQRTNSFLRSEEFDNASWSNTGSTVIANDTTSPSGIQNADRITTTGGLQIINQSPSLTVGQPFVFSVFAKAGNWGIVRIGNVSSATSGAWFNVSNGTTGTINGGTSEIINYGNGWYRLIARFTSFATGSSFIGISDANGSTTAPAAGSFMYFWGAQIEAGSFVSSYIPTTTATVTRIADAARTAVGATSLFASQWTAFGELVIPARGTAGTATGYGLRSVYGSTSLANWPFFIIHGTGATSTLDFQWVVSGSIAKTANVAITYGTRFKFAATSDGTLYINGSLSSASSSLTPTTPVEFGLGRLGQADFSAGESALHNQAALFTTRLTNAQLAQLTTL